MRSAAAFLFSWRHATERAILTAELKGGPFRSKYRESSWIWRQNELIISKRKVRATYWRKNPTNYRNKIRRYLRRKIRKLPSLFFPPSSKALSCLMADERATKCGRHLWAICKLKRAENICCDSEGANLLHKKNHYLSWVMWPESSKELMKCKIMFSTLFQCFCSLIIISQ